MTRKLANRIWPPVFAIITAMMLGFFSGYVFSISDRVNDTAIAVIGISWVIIPIAMGLWAKRLALQGKLPGTGTVAE